MILLHFDKQIYENVCMCTIQSSITNKLDVEMDEFEYFNMEA